MIARERIPFTKPALLQDELKYVQQVLAAGVLRGDGPMGKACEALIGAATHAKHVSLSHSGTAALEMSALAIGLEPGDEVIMPSFTFSSTANAVVLRGARPVFVDIRPDTLNIDEKQIESAISERTKAIYVVHYAGVPADMEPILSISARFGLPVVEDAAQAYLSTYQGKPAGTLGSIGCFSFHETKNIVSGEGGALITNDDELGDKVSIIAEKGTNRRAFLKGEVDKYTWQTLGSSYHPGEVVAAVLRAQLENADRLTQDRILLWNRYYQAFSDLEDKQVLRRPKIPSHSTHNAHIFYLLLPSERARDALLGYLRNDGIEAPFHYIPLHSSLAGQKWGRTNGKLSATVDIAGRLIRLPLYADLGSKIDFVIERARYHLRYAVR